MERQSSMEEYVTRLSRLEKREKHKEEERELGRLNQNSLRALYKVAAAAGACRWFIIWHRTRPNKRSEEIYFMEMSATTGGISICAQQSKREKIPSENSR